MKKEFLSFPRSAKLYLLSQFLLAGYYTWPFWYGFASQTITPTQFGIYLAVFYIVGLIAEIPTGAFADNYGRRLSGAIGAFCGVIMPLVIYFGENFSAFIVGAIIAGIGGAFTSGSLESLVHDLPEMTKETYRRVMIHDTFFWQSGLIISTALGGFMYTTRSAIPFFTQSISFLLATIVILRMSSDKLIKKSVSKTYGQKLIKYLSTNKKGFSHLFEITDIRPLIIFGVTLNVIMWMCIEYLNEAAMISYSIPPEFRGLLLSGTKIIALLILNLFVLRTIKSDKQKLVYLLLMTLSVLSLFSFGTKSMFLLGFLGFNLISAVNSNFIRPIIHDHIDSKWRATAISSYSFVSNIAQAISAVIIGISLQSNGVLFVQRLFIILFIVIGIPALLSYLPRINVDKT
jgi:MFS family permease